MLRLARTMRVLRVTRFLRDLRVLLTGILSSIKSLFWALALLLMVTYLFSVCILETLCSPAVDITSASAVMTSYSSVLRVMYTLFQTVMGGVDWGSLSDPLLEISV